MGFAICFWVDYGFFALEGPTLSKKYTKLKMSSVVFRTFWDL